MTADRCAQYVDDVGIAAHTVDELLQNIQWVFQRIEIAGLKWSMRKCTFGQDKIEFFAKTVNEQSIATLPKKSTVF